MYILQENTVWVNHFLKKSKRRTISDIRKSIGDGITLVYLLESLGKFYLLVKSLCLYCPSIKSKAHLCACTYMCETKKYRTEASVELRIIYSL